MVCKIFIYFTVCTDGTNNVGGCSGDSGGPLTTEIGCVTTQIGIVSFSVDQTCEGGYPTVFTRVTYYLDWINANKT